MKTSKAWEDVTTLEDIKERIEHHIGIPSRWVDGNIQLWVLNKNFNALTDVEDLGEISTITLKDFKYLGRAFELTVSAERNGKELVNITHIYFTDWITYDNPSEIFWEIVIPELIKANVIPEDEFGFNGNITYKYLTDDSIDWDNNDEELPLKTSERIALKILRDVFYDISTEALEYALNIDMHDEHVKLSISILPNVFDANLIKIFIMADHYNYSYDVNTSIFELKNELLKVRKELEELGIYKKIK